MRAGIALAVGALVFFAFMIMIPLSFLTGGMP